MNTLLRTFTLIILATVTSLSAFAQQTWVWEQYDVSIDLPDDFEVQTNTDNEFEAAGEGDMGLYMYIFEEDITLEDMKDATLAAAGEMELEDVDAVQSVHTRGFDGKYVAGYKDGAAILLAGLINPDNMTNFFVVITFHDDDDVAEEDAFAILDSIRKN